LRSFSSESDEEDSFEGRWQSVGANLRAGLARYIIVVDDVPDQLERIIRFIVLRSSIDIRLVQIQKYPDQSGQTIFVPFNIVDVAPSDRPQTVGSQPEIAVDFQAVLDAYSAKAEPNFKPFRTAKTYRFIRPSTWPSKFGIHYELVKTEKGVSPEIHLESDSVKFLAPFLKEFSEQSNVDFLY